MIGGKAFQGFIAQSCLQYFGDLTFWAPETFEFQEEFVESASGILLLEISSSFLSVGYCDTCLKEKEDGLVIKTQFICRV